MNKLFVCVCVWYREGEIEGRTKTHDGNYQRKIALQRAKQARKALFKTIRTGTTTTVI